MPFLVHSIVNIGWVWVEHVYCLVEELGVEPILKPKPLPTSLHPWSPLTQTSWQYKVSPSNSYQLTKRLGYLHDATDFQ